MMGGKRSLQLPEGTWLSQDHLSLVICLLEPTICLDQEPQGTYTAKPGKIGME